MPLRSEIRRTMLARLAQLEAHDMTLEMAVGYALSVQIVAKARELDIPITRRVRCSHKLRATLVACRESRVLWIDIDTLATENVRTLIERAVLDAHDADHPEQLPEHHDSFALEQHEALKHIESDKLEAPQRYSCLLCDKDMSARAIHAGQTFDVCTPHARQVKAALGRKVTIITVHKF